MECESENHFQQQQTSNGNLHLEIFAKAITSYLVIGYLSLRYILGPVNYL
jgi:hypothetical protein